MMIVHMIGNAHIDPVWLWPWQEGVDEALATVRAAADRCDEYPEFIFTRGEAWLYQQIERLDPALFERVRRAIERGQWHVTGGQYLQPDANLPTLMGWRRQILSGQRYFQDRFGVRPNVGYNVDSFGHPATVPDILQEFGYLGYVFHRPNATQVALPASTFRWRGVNGGEVLGFRITPAYVTHSGDLYGQISISLEAADPDLGHTMCFYGVGNHGGGPTKRNIEYILEHVDAFPGVELRFSTPQDFFEAIAPQRERLPVVTHELQHTFPGCYSVMHDIKQAQHYTEHLLDQSERLIATLVEDEDERSALQTRLDTAWSDLLFTEFHDILAGTSVPAAWDSVRAMQGRARIVGEEIELEASRRWSIRTLATINAHQIVAINPDEAPRQAVIEFEPWLDWDAWGGRRLTTLEGERIEYQRVQPQTDVRKTRLVFPLDLPAQSHMQVLIRDDRLEPEEPPETDLDVSPNHLVNGRLHLTLVGTGIGALSLDGRALLGDGGIGLHLRHDHTDTWTFPTDSFIEDVSETFRGKGWLVEESGPIRARVRLEGTVGNSWVRWTLSLYRGAPRVEVDLEVNFGEQFKALQMPINLASTPTRRTDGLAGGEIDRPSGPAEWPLQGWSRVQVDGVELALVTGDSWSVSQDGLSWQWTLLRSPKMAWMGREPDVYAGHDWHTDQGVHTFHFTLYGGEGLDNAALHTAARHSMQPPIVFSRYEGLSRPPWPDSPPAAMWGAAEQRAHADGMLEGD